VFVLAFVLFKFCLLSLLVGVCAALLKTQTTHTNQKENKATVHITQKENVQEKKIKQCKQSNNLHIKQKHTHTHTHTLNQPQTQACEFLSCRRPSHLI
jgi:hypothetical protein